MTSAEFEKITSKLEEPSKNEKAIKIDGTKIDDSQITDLLNI